MEFLAPEKLECTGHMDSGEHKGSDKMRTALFLTDQNGNVLFLP